MKETPEGETESPGEEEERRMSCPMSVRSQLGSRIAWCIGPPLGQQRWVYKAQIISHLFRTSNISCSVNFSPASLLPDTKPTQPLPENKGVVVINLPQDRCGNKRRWLCGVQWMQMGCLAVNYHEGKVHSRFFPGPLLLVSSLWTL